jgi:flagellin
MDVGALANLALNASAQTQQDLMTQTQRLSSGLRINSAADDPSGLAIATSLATKVAGLDQGVQEIQDANNALTIADGAMATISDILQRMRTLVVEANSDLESQSDLNDIQSELNQLTLEINTISESTTYNGRNLLDGSASSDFPMPTQIMTPQNPTASGGGTLYDGLTVSNAAPEVVQSFTVNSFDPTTNMLTVTVDFESTDPNFGGSQIQTFQVAAGTNQLNGLPPPPYFQSTQQGFGASVLSFAIGTLTAADVGKTAVLYTLSAQTKAPGGNLSVNTGEAEGSVMAIDIPAVNANNLGVSEVQVGDSLINEGDEYRIDYAIQYLGAIRAHVGAQNVSLQEAMVNSNTAAVNQQASESAIRDLDVATAVTEYTKDQIQVTIQNRMVAGVQTLAQQFATLVSDAIVA